MTNKFSVRKYDGDDCYSWAVFRAADVTNLGSPVCSGQAKPLVSGCSRAEAQDYARQFKLEKRK